MTTTIRKNSNHNVAKRLWIFISFFAACISTSAFADDTQDLKKIVAIQQAQLAAQTKALRDLDSKLSASQAKSISDIDALSTRIDSKLDAGRDVGSGSCVMAKSWGSCPSGFQYVGNFYSCWTEGATVGTNSTAAEAPCTVPYAKRHIQVCCR